MSRLPTLLLICTGTWVTWAGAQEVDPSPSYGPQDVVRIQLEALADNDTPLPNSGVAVAFRFASPSNRMMTGPLDRFTLMVNSEPYRGMIDHRDAEILEPVETPAHTLVPVRLTTAEGITLRFVFVLSAQVDGSCLGCWMTDAVMAVDQNEGPGRAL